MTKEEIWVQVYAAAFVTILAKQMATSITDPYCGVARMAWDCADRAVKEWEREWDLRYGNEEEES